jgi:hypothetical protein
MFMLFRITLDTSKIGWRLLLFFGSTISAPMSCMNPDYRMRIRRIITNSVVGRASCKLYNCRGIQWSLRMNRFTVYPRPRTARREQPAFKVKSILKGTEYEGKPCMQLYNKPDFYVTSQSPAKNWSAIFTNRLPNKNASICLHLALQFSPTSTCHRM